MDTSKEYIKMCDCPEIQGEWKQQNGDYVFGELNGDVLVLCFAIHGQLNKSWSRWLPRQDQIQEMMKDHFELGDIMESFVFLATHILSELPKDSHYQKARTPEQLWLAFYMWEKHKKIWDGKKWKQ